MSNETAIKDRFLSVFRRKWGMFGTREAASTRMSSGKPSVTSSARFDPSPVAGELRVFADFAEPVTVLLLGVSGDVWKVVPVSPFSVPASDREILIGARVFQLWNACDLPTEIVARSWIVDTLPAEDLADVNAAVGAMRGGRIEDDLASCMGAPITAADDPRHDYERTFRLSPPVSVSIAAPVRHKMWRPWTLAIAASLLLVIGWPIFFLQEKSVDSIAPSPDAQVRTPSAAQGVIVKGVVAQGKTAASDLAEPLCDLEVPADEIVAPMPAPTVKNADSVQFIDSPYKMKTMVASRVPRCRGGASESYRSCVPEERHVRREPAAPVKDVAYSERYAAFNENEFLEVKGNPLSTFGLDVDTASYATMRRYVNEMKRLPPKDSVRIEEYVNYFSYNYAGPTGNVPVAVACELGACPWNAAHRLLRVGVQAKRVPKEAMPPCNLVFLIDKSGSMDYNGGFAMLIQALKMLVGQLRPEDSVAIVSYASGVKVEMAATSGAEKERIMLVLDSLHAGGATSGGAGLQLAYEEAMKSYSAKKNNRVVLVTDGDFNVGINNPSELERFIADKRKTGVFLTVLGVGRGNYQDAMMKKLANAGNGNYAFLDGVLEAKKVLMAEFGGTMMTVAKDVKLQLEFNPAQVAAYRLLGYENRLLAAKDFNDDKKDAGEMGSGHSMTAFYELVPAGATNAVAVTDALKYQKQVPVASGELLTVKLRYKLPDAETSTRIDQPVTAEAITQAQPSESFRFASAVAEFALLMKDSAYKGSASYDAVIKRAKGAKGRDDDGWRAEFIRLVESAQLLKSPTPSNRNGDMEVQVDPGI